MDEQSYKFRPTLTDQDLFVMYSPPNDANHYLMIQNDPNPSDLNVDHFQARQNGFLLSPFKGSKQSTPIFIKEDQFIINPSIDFRPLQEFDRKCMSKGEYFQLADNYINTCKDEKLEKLVLSRIKSRFRDNANMMPLFLSLKKSYPYAFIYLLNIPGDSCWIGATPEVLIQKSGEHYKTMALAGTQKSSNQENDNISWGEKEVHEHKVVEDYFENIISLLDSDFNKNGPYDKRVGHVVHICTDFEFQSDAGLKNILEVFDPSPAVCGMPKKKANQYIHNTEPHDRRYYTGFLGPVRKSEDLNLFVNLRCMEVSSDYFFMYVGGGITMDSQSESEWIETELKSATLLTLIEKMYLYADVVR